MKYATEMRSTVRKSYKIWHPYCIFSFDWKFKTRSFRSVLKRTKKKKGLSFKKIYTNDIIPMRINVKDVSQRMWTVIYPFIRFWRGNFMPFAWGIERTFGFVGVQRVSMYSQLTQRYQVETCLVCVVRVLLWHIHGLVFNHFRSRSTGVNWVRERLFCDLCVFLLIFIRNIYIIGNFIEKCASRCRYFFCCVFFLMNLVNVNVIGFTGYEFWT